MSDRISELRELLNQDPEDAFLRYAYALELEKAGDVQQASDWLIQLINDIPGYLAAYYQAARILNSEGKVEEAVRVIEDGIVIAGQQQNRHTLSELKYLRFELTGDDE